MPEIDPQSERQLTESLRRLAASSRQGAPAEIGTGLMTAFRQHHVRRKRIRRIRTGILGLCFIVLAAAISIHRAPQQPSGVAKQGAAQPPDVAAVKLAPEKKHEDVQAIHVTDAAPRPVEKRRQPKAVGTRLAANHPFLALPGYDPTVPMDELHVVRMQMPATALWQIGAPVVTETGSRKMTADFVVSQDGTPYAVRLVQ